MTEDPRACSTTPGRISLSLILCSRNDHYAGNAVWRLQTSLNYLALQAEALKRASAVEVIVTDWGSRIPLRQALVLSPVAARMTRFLEVPPELAALLQKDSPFPEVLANNAAIRRAQGDYIGRIDQDTLISRTFIEYFLGSFEDGSGPNKAAVMFGGRRSIPIEVVRRSPPFEKVVRYIDRFGPYLPPEGKGRTPWFDAPTGIFVMSRELWWEARGYDERMLYWGFMEAEVVRRLASRHPIVNLGSNPKCRFFHLSHSTRRFLITDRRKNPRLTGDLDGPQDGWGLAAHALRLCEAEPSEDHSTPLGGQDESPSNSIGDLASLSKEWMWQVGLILPRWAYAVVRRERRMDSRK